MKMFSDDHDWIMANNFKEVKTVYELIYEQKIENENEWRELDNDSKIEISADIYDFISQFNDGKLPSNYKLDEVGGRIVVITTVGKWLKITKEPQHFMALDW